MCNENRDCKCISDILKVINILQRNANRREEELDTCDKRTLGSCCFLECNTRPIQLITCGGNGNDPLVMPTEKGPITCHTKFSDVFRVEKVDECCCTCRVLKAKKNRDEHEEENHDDECEEFEATDSFFTIDLHCCCAVKCLDDTFVECV